MIFPFCIKLLHIGQSDVYFYLMQPACSKYYLFAISFEHHFFPTCRRESAAFVEVTLYRVPYKLRVYQFLHSGLSVKKLISPIIDFRALLLRERIWHGKFDGIKVIGQFLSCLEAATRKCPPKQLFFWSWINPWNNVWTCMFLLNFSNKELVQKHLVQRITWHCIPGIDINILSINQFKVLNTFALRAWQTKIFLAKIWKIKFQFSCSSPK